MTDILTPKERSELMGRIRSADTKPELFVRRALHARGYWFRTHVRKLPGCPDLVFSRRRAVIFVHGCFWHRHGCKRTYIPKSRQEFWESKFAGNVKRELMGKFIRDRRDILRGENWRREFVATGRSVNHFTQDPKSLFPRAQHRANDPNMFSRIGDVWFVNLNLKNHTKFEVLCRFAAAAGYEHKKD